VEAKPMGEWRSKWALVTGASAGIGQALAEELAAGGTHLIVTARRRERLEELAARLRKAHGVSVEIVVADLAQRAAREELFAFTREKGIAVELLVNNAGLGAYGEFPEMERERLLEMVEVNVAAVIHLTHLFLPGMVERRRGDVLILSSTAAFQAVPYISAYAATKAFDLLFGEGLAEEMRSRGIRVCVLCPGSTVSEFHAVAGQPDFTKGRQESARKVARRGLRGLARGKSLVISGFGNWMGVVSQRLAARRMVTRVAAGMFKPR
jgi:short-subunit dehydrogenase